MKYLKSTITISNPKDLLSDYPEGTLILTDKQEIIDKCQQNGVPVVAFEHDECTGLKCNNILIDVDDVDDIVFENIYRREKGLPLDIAYTERTLIREFTMGDLDALVELYNKPHMTDYMEPLFEYNEEKEYQQNYINYIYKMYGFGMWLIFDKITGELIGRAGIEVRDTCDRDEQAEMGFAISSDRWGQGLGYEVCSKVMELARDEFGFTSLIARCSPENVFSKHLLEKLGFQHVRFEADGDCRYFREL